MLDYGRYDYDLWTVANAEKRPTRGEDLEEEGRLYYEANPDLLKAHERAAWTLEEYGLKVSARFLTELVRWLSKYWYALPALMECYRDVVVNARTDFKIPNATSPWLTRYLEGKGFEVTKSKSKLDEVKA